MKMEIKSFSFQAIIMIFCQSFENRTVANNVERGIVVRASPALEVDIWDEVRLEKSLDVSEGGVAETVFFGIGRISRGEGISK